MALRYRMLLCGASNSRCLADPGWGEDPPGVWRHQRGWRPARRLVRGRLGWPEGGARDPIEELRRPRVPVCMMPSEGHSRTQLRRDGVHEELVLRTANLLGGKLGRRGASARTGLDFACLARNPA